MTPIEVSRNELWALAGFLLCGGIMALGFMVILLRRAWINLKAEQSKPPDAPERLVAEDEWHDGISRMVLVITTTSVGIIFALGLLFGELKLQGLAGVILALIWAIQGGVPLYQEVHSFGAQQRLIKAIKRLRARQGDES